MNKFIAILRGINVGGHRKILMKAFKELLENEGLIDVQTYIQSGNILFKSKQKSDELQTLITNIIKTQYGFDVPVIIRSAKEWQLIFENNPFLLTGKNVDINNLHVTFLSELPSANISEVINAFSCHPDELRIVGREIYLLLANKSSDSKLTNAFFEQKLKVTASNRNWKTVTKLFELSKTDA